MTSAERDSALLHAILDAAVDAMIVADDCGSIMRANPAACHLFQYDADDLVGKSVNILMTDTQAELHDKHMSHHLQTNEKRVIGLGREVEGKRKDTTVFPLHLSIGRADMAGQTMFVGIWHDLTLRKAAQDALSRSQRLDAITQMTGGIAHDFNNLLTVIIGNLELLETGAPSYAHRKLIRDCLDAAEIGAELTSQLMIFARKANLRAVKSNLRSLCEQTLPLLRQSLGPTIQIEADLASDISPVMVDPAQLQSALLNLALNARDAMDSNGQLLVSVANIRIDDAYMAQEIDMKPGDYVRLSVSDNGGGMSIEAQQRAFEPFFTTKSESGGNGLGLAMVYGFVLQSGGHITLYSEIGHGSSFSLYFPAIASEHVANATSSTVRDRNRSSHIQGQTILIVEDNPKVRKLSVERIRSLGFCALEAENGDVAYDMLKSGIEVDAVFSDLVMPGDLNGYDLAQKVVAEFPGIKVLLTSGYASDVVTTSMSQDRAHHILHKPYRQSELALKLQALFSDEPED